MAKQVVLEFYGLVDANGNLFDLDPLHPGRATLFTSLEDIERERKVHQRTKPVKIVPIKIVEETK